MRPADQHQGKSKQIFHLGGQRLTSAGIHEQEIQVRDGTGLAAARVRAQTQFKRAAITVNKRISDLLRSVWVARARHIRIPSTGNAAPPGKRKSAAWG